MIVLGIILFLVGALIAWLAGGDIGRLGYAVAVIGVILIVVGLILGLADDADDELDAGAVLAPLLVARLRR